MMSEFPQELADRLEAAGVIAVLMIEELKAAVPLARTLYDHGVHAMELTLRTPVALEALRAIRSEVPEMLAGIGTVLFPEQVTELVQAGAAFGVAPGTNPRILAAAQDQGLPFAPGVATPTDVEMALQYGCRLLKFFPAEPSGGLAYLRSLAAPFAHLGVRYLPLGGVNMQNLESYLREPAVQAVGGSWLAPKDLVQAGNWEQIGRLASDARRVVDTCRPR